MAALRQLGPFRLSAPLGRGGMGEVWRAVHEREQVEVAVKLIEAGTPAALRQVEREVRAVAGLQHPGVIGLFDHGSVNGLGWLAMELAPDGTARDQPPRDQEQLRQWVLQILDALAHAHARDVVHRDLKPSNLLRFGEHLKLADFGIARAGGESGSVAAGTPLYMAPEQVRADDAAQGPWTDLYALGCVVHEWLTGRPPFGDMGGHLHASPAPIPEHPRWSDWVLALLRKAPEARPASAAEAAWLLPEASGAAVGAPRMVALPTRTVAGMAPEGVETSDLPAAARSNPTLDLPVDWRQRPVPQRHLYAAGLGLFGLRPVPLVGREPVQDALWDAFRASDSACRAVVLSGPSGVGKSRLARWLAERGAECGASVWSARHSPQQGAGDGVGPMIERNLGSSDRWTRWLYHREGRPGLAEAIGALVHPAEQGFRFRSPTERYDAVAELIRLRGGRPILWLDDLQWGLDAAGLADHLFAANLPSLLVITVRNDVRVDLGGLLARDGCAEIHVGPLEAAHWRSLVQGMLGIDSPLASRIAERTAGNPLFAVQLVGDWVNRGILTPGDGGFDVPSGASLALPEDVVAVWRARIERLLADLSPQARTALELAATLGVDVASHELDAASAELGIPVSRELIDRMLATNLARGSPDGWSFAHGMLRETVLADAPDPAPLHAACADALMIGEPPPSGRIGRHLRDAGKLEACLEPLLNAARGANMALDYPGARALLDEREQVLDRLGLTHRALSRAKGHLVQITVLRNLGRWSEAEALCEQVVEAGDPTAADWRHVLADAHALWALLRQFRGEYQAAIASADRARDLGGGDLTHHQVRAVALISLRRYDEAIAECEAGLVEPEMPATGAAELSRLRGECEWRLGRLDAAIPWFERAIEASQATGNRVTEMLTMTELGAVHHLRANYAEAVRWYEGAIDVVGGPQMADALAPRSNLATVQALQGELTAAYAAALVILAQAEKMRWSETAVYARVVCWACAPTVDEQDERYPEMAQSVQKAGLVDTDFMLLADAVGARRRALGDALGAQVAEAFAADQRQRGATLHH